METIQSSPDAENRNIDGWRRIFTYCARAASQNMHITEDNKKQNPQKYKKHLNNKF